ncbi:ribbon-helix-helix domain-containing protein [Cytobacillus praedii]|uniref:ribbon-helix-helix domain-containing protein n=1 Tax=Cytobacillus praedii TaxID=1742358 RepID=UPI002E1BF504|nr:ribbon-helix-helix domain-containing protein [Cytobacillus praedii]MED3575065.1 ribbon-helix-helix domain-containing protein [Cytobacillus praedii]
MSTNNQLVNRKRFSNSLRNDLAIEFDKLHNKTQIPKSKLLDEAIELLLEKRNHPIPKD